jgi:isoleucyl-tRNA synthetase
VHPEFTYALVEFVFKGQKRRGIMAAELVDAVMKRVEIADYKILATCTGASLEGLTLQHPFYQRQVPIILGEHVTIDTGTGCVHTAPAHGQEDYVISEKYHLPVDNPVGSDGCYIASTPLLAGVHVFKANDLVIDLLKEKECLLHAGKVEHSYPHCWRHKIPLIFRATQQWFISMEQNGLREAALQAIRTVKWVPSWGQARIEGFIADRPDWCISRQRTWGVPMCLFVHRETGDIHPRTPELLEAVARRIEKAGIDAWYDLDAAELLGTDAQQYEKAMDTLDVWFDSGVVHSCVLEKRKELTFPADLYLEGSDQHRGWFNSSLMTSVAMKNRAPYRQVLTHGFTVDSQGRKMSKSLGNVIAPEKVIQSLGADILRLWVSSVDYRAEIVVSDEIFTRISDTYRRIRNTARFLLANLNGFDPQIHLTPFSQMITLDRFIVDRVRILQAEIIQAYDEYQFHLIYQKIHNFCANDLGSFYLDVIKDRQYTGQADGLPRRSAQTALYYIVESLVRWMAPILSFTAEEIWQNLPGDREASVFLSEWYKNLPSSERLDEMDQAYWQQVLAIRDAVNKALEEARNAGIIGSGLEAEVELYCHREIQTLLSKLGTELRFVLITSTATVHSETERLLEAKETVVPGLWVAIKASNHPKCVRCWHRRAEVNENPEYPGICSRCIENVAGVGEIRQYA